VSFRERSISRQHELSSTGTRYIYPYDRPAIIVY